MYYFLSGIIDIPNTYKNRGYMGKTCIFSSKSTARKNSLTEMR